MLAATSGVNTHRGAIFGLGLLCAAAGARAAGRVKAGTVAGRDRRAALGRRHSRWSRTAAQPRQHGPAAVRRGRCAHGGRPGVSQRLRGRLARPAAGCRSCARRCARPRASRLASRSSPRSRTPICCIAAAWPACGSRSRAARDFLDAGGVGRPDWRERAQAVHEELRGPPAQSGRVGGPSRHDPVRRRARSLGRLMPEAILLALAPIFFVLALGYARRRLRIVDNHQVDSLNALVMDFALPASLFVATASATRSRDARAGAALPDTRRGHAGAVFRAGIALHRAFSETSKADASLQALTIAFPNLAGVGLPIASSVLGPAGTVPSQWRWRPAASSSARSR